MSEQTVFKLSVSDFIKIRSAFLEFFPAYKQTEEPG
jgi:hypothetical protein